MVNDFANGRCRIAYKARRGVMYWGSAEQFFYRFAGRYRKKIQLILTSPPFPLNRKKAYGNLQGEAYIKWLASFAPLFKEVLTEDGSIVMEIGNAWEPGRPVMSTLAVEALLEFVKSGNLKLAEQFVCYNPARLPSPAQWVNVERIRVKDSYTHVWWMSACDRPLADNRNILRDYSPSMIRLLKTGRYNAGPRPSEHHIGKKSFLRNNGGAIPSNVLTFANTGATDPYQVYCRENELRPHPARMPTGLAEFFINFLTSRGDLVMDPFAGSNTTGATAARLKRRWVSVETEKDYVDASYSRFAERAVATK
jgi:hypothetical protein